MNILVFQVFRGVHTDGMMGPAPFQTAAFGSGGPPPPPSGNVLQLITLQAIGNAGMSNP